MKEKIINLIKENSKDFSLDDYNEIVGALYETHPLKHNPVARVQFIDVDKIEPNDYNPNAVAKQEMKLLETSIDHDGYTQPTVTIYDKDKGKYVIVDGFHRYYVMKTSKLINERNGGKLPIVVLDKGINDRMASTVRHNRARGKHSLTGMGRIVMELAHNGMSDEQICNELGLEVDELVRLKHTTGIADLFKDSDYTPEKKPDYQIEREYDPTNPNSKPIENDTYKNVKLEWDDNE